MQTARNTNKFWLVGMYRPTEEFPGRKIGAFNQEPKHHTKYTLARLESERLAKRFPDCTFIVFEAVTKSGLTEPITQKIGTTKPKLPRDPHQKQKPKRTYEPGLI